jgi:hypothetical protein
VFPVGSGTRSLGTRTPQPQPGGFPIGATKLQKPVAISAQKKPSPSCLQPKVTVQQLAMAAAAEPQFDVPLAPAQRDGQGPPYSRKVGHGGWADWHCNRCGRWNTGSHDTSDNHLWYVAQYEAGKYLRIPPGPQGVPPPPLAAESTGSRRPQLPWPRRRRHSSRKPLLP